MLVIGHRGARGHAPENTLASVEKAIDLGADCVEVDVHLVESVLVVMHDERVDRTTDGRGALARMTFRDLRALDAGNGERVPTLDEVLDTADGRVGVNVELKGRGTATPVAELLERRGGKWEDRMLISSFDHRMLAEARARAPHIKVGALFVGLLQDDAAFATRLGAYSVHPSEAFLDERLVRDAHDRGLRVFPFTVNDAEGIERVRAMGADGVFTDYPDRVPRSGRPLLRFPRPGETT